MKYLTFKEQLRNERKRNEALRAELLKNKSDVDYIAMMCDVELETEENNTIEFEGVDNNEQV